MVLFEFEDDNHAEIKPKSKTVDDGYKCDKCGSYVKRYTRKFNSNMCIALLALYKHSYGNFVHLEQFLNQHGYQRCGDATYLVYYGFIEKKLGKRDDNSNRNGMYKLTGRGLLFVEGKLKAAEKFRILHNCFEGFTGKEMTFKEALGTKFDYQKMMNEK